ncbi:MAG: hypothetical protein JXA90_08465, partial [Planctomycetes bacterium]|nr:hypothetical protein [Planctomycetota bacterium]
MRFLRRLLVFASIFAGLLILVAVSVYVIFGRDVDPPNDADLLPVFRQVAAEENGFHLVDFTEEDLTGTDEAEELWELFVRGRDLDPMTEGSAEEGSDAPDSGDENVGEEAADDDFEPIFVEGWDEALARKIVADNAAYLGRLDDCLARPDFAIKVDDPADPDFGYLSAWRDLVSIVQLKTALLMLDEKPEAAIAECGKILRFGRRIQRSQGALHHGFYGNAIIVAGLEAIRGVLARSAPESDTLRRLADELGEYGVDSAALVDLIRGEYLLASSLVDSLLERPQWRTEAPEGSWFDRLFLRLTFKPQKTKQIIASEYRSLLEYCQSPGTQVQPPPEPELDVFNLRGAEVYSILSPTPWGPIYFRLVRGQDFFLRAHRLLLALRCHEMEQGSLPESL